MKKGISIWSFKDKPLRQNFEIAKKTGFDGVEVALAESGEINLSSTEKQLLEIKKQAAESGIELYSVASGLYWDYSLTDDDKDIREKAKNIVKKQLETAKILGCDTILVIPGAVGVDFIPNKPVVDYQNAYNRSLEAFFELKEYAEKLKVAIALENVWNKFLVSPLEMREFIDKIDSEYVGSYLDIGNTLYNGYPEHWVRILGERIKKVHFKDYRKAAGGLHGFVDLLAGDVNFPEVVKTLNEIKYDGWVTAEMIPSYTYYGDAIIQNTSNAMDKILGREKC